MIQKNNSGVMVYLILFIAGIMIVPMFSSCGKGEGVSSSNNNARLGVVNLSPDVLPFKLYGRYIVQGTNSYSYPFASSYTLINVADTPIQIRTAQTANNVNPTNLLTLTGGLLRNTPYTLFVMGLLKDNSLTSVLTVDTSSLPANGRGKIRLVNGITNVPSGINLTLNDTTAFRKVNFKGNTQFIEVTAGTYNINIVPNNNPTKPLTGLTNFTILDGKMYTIFSYGLSSSTSDSVSYGINTILNTLPPNTRY
ncbi:DUF4397 domain-containing protein [Mucilaginibacter conchicola]|uniref:DUF4397 domain-containing protein n=1 Tax=Mucilaginibacter conchicola TaxID=2303333 RepID=A0A372NZM9_9SPHI|nr:DUF4397 domain-containing protein [Mucilaginibacter conchicola]RFZ95129.1 DUF4397 domain-containing protein [Mucilaginibacter conchicola]